MGYRRSRPVESRNCCPIDGEALSRLTTDDDILEKGSSELPNGIHTRLGKGNRRLYPARRTFIAVVGEDCTRIEDLIDEIVVGEGTSDRSILTSSHPNETVAHAVAFAKSLTGEYEGEEVQVVEII